MRVLLLVFCLVFALAPASAQEELKGSWTSSFVTETGEDGQLSLIFNDGYFVMSSYTNNAFVATLGGTYTADWQTFSIKYDFDSSTPSNVGDRATMPYRITGNALVFNGDKVWTRADDNSGSALAGAWVIVGRKRGGEMRRRPATGPRQTIKILSGTRFQWIAFNTDTAEMLGTGGGTYTTDDGIYIERIEFFSRDDSRVGQQLSFDYKIRNSEWHHSGLGSEGTPIYEVWGRRKR